MSNLAVDFSQFDEAEVLAMEFETRCQLAMRYAEEKDILNWGRVVFPDKFSLPFCKEMHSYFVEIRKEEYTTTEAPRNHSKTTINCFLIPIFQALEEPETFKHYLNVQSTATKAIDINKSIKHEFEKNEMIFELYGDMRGETWKERQIVLTNGVIFTAIGAEQSMRGLNYNNKRPDYLIIDDLYDGKDIYNRDSTDKKNEWFWGSLFPSRSKTTAASVHIQGTAINNEDLLEVLKSKERWINRTFKAIINEDEGDVLWPELKSYEHLVKERIDQGTIIFNRESQNERHDMATAIIKREYIQEFDPTYKKLFNDQFKVWDVILAIDPSIGDTKSEKKSDPDYTAIALILKASYVDGYGNYFYILKLWNQRLSLNQRIELLNEIDQEQNKEFEETKVDYRITDAPIEAIGGFKDFSAEAIRRTDLPIRSITSVSDKVTHLVNKSHFFEQRKVFINKYIPKKLKDEWIYQMTTNYPRHDDMRDATLHGMTKGE